MAALRIFNKLMDYFVEYIDVINCFIVWFVFTLLTLNYYTDFSFNFYIFRYIAYFDWLIFIYGFMRVRYFKQKSIKNILLFALNLITFPAYLLMVPVYLAV